MIAIKGKHSSSNYCKENDIENDKIETRSESKTTAIIEEEEYTTDYDSSESEGEEDSPIYTGKRDSNGKPNGRGTLTWNISGTRFEGRFSRGEKEGKGTFYFPDKSTLSGLFTSDELNGMALYTYSDGSKMEAYYSDGELNGPFIEYDSNGSITIKGFHKDNKRTGFLQIFDNYGGILMGTVDIDGYLTGPNIAYIYPDHYCALVGQFINGEMKKAGPAKLHSKLNEQLTELPQFDFEPSQDCYMLHLDESTSTCISSNPLINDVYEQTYVYVGTTLDKGEGLFAKINLQSDQIVSFYNGIRITHNEVDARPWSLNSNTISLDDNIVLDVPSLYSKLDVYCASLGHKANHSNTPNCKYDEFVHPRFGFIKCIRTLEKVSQGTELTCDYGYCHKIPGTQDDDLPQWFVKDVLSS